MKTIARSLLVTLPLLCATVALAQHQALTLNPDSSDVKFTLASNHDTTNGTIDFDRNSLKMSGLVVVAAGSGNTGSSGRDKKMTTEVLEAAKFAEVTFVPQSYQGSIAPAGDSTIQVTGIFTLHGTAHDLTVPMQIHIEGARCTAKTHFEVPFVEWGLKDPSWFVLKVAKQADVDLSLVGSLSPAS
jgi:polyisoprenoid-binding protein YceI